MMSAAMPRRLKEAFGRVLKADQAATGPLPPDRAAYEARAQASAPAADKVAEAQELPVDGPTERTAA